MTTAGHWLFRLVLAGLLYLTLTYNRDGLVNTDGVTEAIGRYAEDVGQAIADAQGVGS